MRKEALPNASFIKAFLLRARCEDGTCLRTSNELDLSERAGPVLRLRALGKVPNKIGRSLNQEH